MRRWLTGSLLGIGLAISATAASQPPVHGVPQSGWFTDYQAAKAVARTSGKPLFVVFRCQP